MKTRFDETRFWVTGTGEAIKISEMETAHLLNTVKMLLQKPSRVQAMLIADIENAPDVYAWTPDDNKGVIRQSIENVTSMDADRLAVYTANTPLFKTMLSELADRGVNIENILSLYTTDEAFMR